MAYMEKKLSMAPEKAYINVETVPPINVVNTKRISTNANESRKFKVNRDNSVIIFGNPILAPGAKTKGEGIERSINPMMTPCAHKIAM